MRPDLVVTTQLAKLPDIREEAVPNLRRPTASPEPQPTDAFQTCCEEGPGLQAPDARMRKPCCCLRPVASAGHGRGTET